MSRRNPGSEAATEVWGARQRLAASLEGAEDQSGDSAGADSPSGRARGLLQLPEPPPDLPVIEPKVGGPTAPGFRLADGHVPNPVDDRRFSDGPNGDGMRRAVFRSAGLRGADLGSADAITHRDGPPGNRRAGRPRLLARLRARTGVQASALLGILAAVLGGCFWWQASTGAAEVVQLREPPPAAEKAHAQATATTPATSGDDSSAVSGTITVHVAGAVEKPGVVQLPAGSRIHQAIAAAGGATETADPDRLNLAAVLEDGQKVQVPVRGAPDPAAQPDAGSEPPLDSGAAGTTPAGGAKINLNTADVEELGTLPRVGPVLAQRIVDWRRQQGRFKNVQELDAVDGIGPKLLEALLPLVEV